MKQFDCEETSVSFQCEDGLYVSFVLRKDGKGTLVITRTSHFQGEKEVVFVKKLMSEVDIRNYFENDPTLRNDAVTSLIDVATQFFTAKAVIVCGVSEPTPAELTKFIDRIGCARPKVTLQ